MANLGMIDFKIGLYIKVNVNAGQNKLGTGHLSNTDICPTRTFVRHGHLSDTDICPTTCTKFCGHLSDNLTSNLFLKQFHKLKGLYQVIIDKHERGIEANCDN